MLFLLTAFYHSKTVAKIQTIPDIARKIYPHTMVQACKLLRINNFKRIYVFVLILFCKKITR